jgi:hypothetical protein
MQLINQTLLYAKELERIVEVDGVSSASVAKVDD